MSATENTADIADQEHKDETAVTENAVNIENQGPNDEKAITPKIEDNKNNNEEKKVSFLELFRYSNKVEKFMVFLGILGAIGQGLTMPIMIQVMGDLINIFVRLVASVNIRDLTGLKDDDKIVEFLDVMLRNNTDEINAYVEANNIDLDNLISKSQGSSSQQYTSDVDVAGLFMKSNDFWDEFHKYMLYLGLIALLSFVASFLMDAFLTISAMRQVTRIRSLTFKSIAIQEIPWHERTSPGELASRIISDTILIEDGIGFKLGLVVQSVVTFIACFILAYKSGWKLALCMSVIIPILLILVTAMAGVLNKFTKKTQDAYADLGGIAQEAFSQIRTIVSFGTEQKEIDRYVKKLAPTRKYGIIKGHAVGATLGLVFGIVYASFSIAFIYGTHLIDKKEMIYGDVLNVFMGIMMGAMMLSGVGVNLSAFSEATGSASKLFEIIERKPEIDLEGGLIPDKPVEGTIEFQDVRFNYPSRPDVEVLKGISFKCLPGQTVALVGASGSGKSTSVQLLERFYNKKSGRILIDGKDIEEYNVKWLRSQIGLVSQEPTLFDATVAKNISINCPEATKEQIENACKLANAHDFILKLSNGYDTSTGERGLQMSGGQKQRICIARALINNPKILLLDEATSALDNKSEKVVQAALDSAASGRTTLVIAHRLSTVKNADLIIVMEKGIIIESGTHDELMKLQKYYYNLVKNQEIKIKEEENEEDEDEDEEAGATEVVQQTQFVEPATTRRETTVLSRIASSILSRRQTTGVFSDYSVTSVKPAKGYDFKDMEWKRYYNYNKPYWLPNCLGFLGALFNGGMQPAFAFIFSSALNTFTKQGDDLIDGGFFWGMMFIVLGVFNFFAFYFNIGGFIIAGEYLSYELRRLMYNNLIRQEVGFFDTNDIGDGSEKAGGQGPGAETKSTGTLTAKLATEAGLVNGLNTNIGQVFQQVVTVVGGFGIAFFNGWKLTLILLVAVPFLFLGSALRMRAIKTKNSENRAIFENSSKIATEAIISIKTVYALNLSNYFIEKYDEKLYEPLRRLEIRAYISSVGTGFSNAVAFLAYILGYWVGAKFVEDGKMEFDHMFKVLMAIILTAMAVGQSSSIVSETQKAVEAFMHVIEIIDRKPKIDASDPNGTKKEEGLTGELEFSEIRFRYPSRPKVTVLRMGDKKIKVPAGKMCAFVGASGSGKSTILGLIPRWYDASHGSVKVDGIENKDYNIKWLRQQIGIVNQEPCLFNISIKENIMYGKTDATDEEVYEAGRKANIHDFVMSLPDKYDTLVGGLGTSQMSGGQKQRVAIARAMIRNPKILLLDEATSALDAESELVVQKALEDASQGRTTVTIAHRLSTIKDADIICVFKEGRIIEMGNHDELMEKKGEYYNMVLAGDGSVAKGNAIAKKDES